MKQQRKFSESRPKNNSKPSIKTNIKPNVKTTNKPKENPHLTTFYSSGKGLKSVVQDQKKRPATASADSRKPEPLTSTTDGKIKQTTQLHFQPRQHSQNPKPKGDTKMASTPKTTKAKHDLSNGSAKKTSNPAMKKASLLYTNIIKAKYEKSREAFLHDSGKAKPSIMPANFAVKSKALKINNSIELLNEKLRNELSINSPKHPVLTSEKVALNEEKKKKFPVNLLKGNPQNRLLNAPRKQQPIEKITQKVAPGTEIIEDNLSDKIAKCLQRTIKPTLLKPNLGFNNANLMENSNQKVCIVSELKKEKTIPKETSVQDLSESIKKKATK